MNALQPAFKSLFAFKTDEVKHLFSHADYKHSVFGLKAVQTSLISSEPWGKLLIITRRTSGKAVSRNKIRRRLKELFYKERFYRYKAKTAIIVYPQAHTLDFNDLKEFLYACFAQH